MHQLIAFEVCIMSDIVGDSEETQSLTINM